MQLAGGGRGLAATARGRKVALECLYIGPLADVRVRKAINYAIDAELIRRTIY
jgi:ABC-type transport system substrate-binding protein